MIIVCIFILITVAFSLWACCVAAKRADETKFKK